MAASHHQLFSVEELREHHVKLMQLIHLPTLLPFLKERELLSPDDLKHVSDTKHFGTIERTGFLLHSMYKKDQKTINDFIDCLREDKDHPGHQEILLLLEGGLPDLPSRSPLFDILDSKLDVIVEQINFTTFLNTLTNSGAIRVTSFLDLVNPDRRVKENLERLVRVLEEKGNIGFIDFLTCLRTDATPGHEDLFKILFTEVQKFFKEDPRRDEIPSSDKIELLQLETRGKVLEKEVVQRFKINFAELRAGLNGPALLSDLQKHHVLSKEEAAALIDLRRDRKQCNLKLLEIVEIKPPFWVVKFAECLKESPEHKLLSELLLPPPPIATAKEELKEGSITHLNDKVLVMVHMEKYVEVDEDYQIREYRPDDFISSRDSMRNLRQNRKMLRNHFAQSNFKIIDLKLNVNMREEQEENVKESKQMAQILSNAFRTQVASKCSPEAIIFIYISGVQFPWEVPSSNGSAPKRKYFSGAILLEGASTISRKEVDCLKARDLLRWLEQLPTAHVTFLIDTEQNFVAKFGKQRQPEVVDILEDPWSQLTDLNSSTVVYYLRPDIRAMAQLAQLRSKDEKLATGMLTECFNFALLHCFVRKSEGQEASLCHRRFYEAISFFWHRRGRQHKIFLPVARGDLSREFLGKGVFPYQQVFRVDLVRSNKKKDIFNLEKLHIQTGTMAGISYGDEMEVFHLLRPGVRVRATVMQSQPLSCQLEIKNEEAKKKLARAVTDIYQDGEILSKDGSTEFLFAVNLLALHERVSVNTLELSESENATIKMYVEKKSPRLSFVSRGMAKLIVRRSGDLYYVDDKDGDVKDQVKVKKVNLILTFLEMIAWYKYVKSLKSTIKPPWNHFNCYLTAEKPLLHTAVPLCNEFNIKWSSFEGVEPMSKGHGAILQIPDSQKFWTPSPPARDPHPCLEVEFKGNHVITAIELKGDYREEKKYMKRADIYHQKDVFNSLVEGPSKEHLSRTQIFSHDEVVQFVTMTPVTMAEDDFNIKFKLTRRTLSGAKGAPREIEGLTIVNWAFHEQLGTGWKFSPSPDENGVIKLGSSGFSWISWSGRSQDPMTLDLGVSGVKLEKIEFTSLTETNYLSKFFLRLQTFWKKEDFPEIRAVWPFKHEFPRPLVISNIQLWPTAGGRGHQSDIDIKVQLQLYGNKHEKPIEVEEGEILSFHFNNYTQHDLFVYIFCLEETGNVKFVMMDTADPIEQGKISTMKKLIQTYIPEGYSPELGRIKDIYKVFICQRKMYMEPFMQRGLSHYHHPCCYTVSSFGPQEVRKEEWYDFTFEVIVKKSSTSRR